LPESTIKTLQPPLKWAGGKRWLVPHLIPMWDQLQGRRLVEPFVGGLAVSLGLLPKTALLNDINPHLINFYRQLQRGLIVTIPMENDSALYYTHRSHLNELIRQHEDQTSEAAQLFYYLNRTGFNGLCRFNQSGEFNVPFGQYKKINYTYDFTAYVGVLSQWNFEIGRFDQTALNDDDAIYADPPYDVEFTSYSKEGFRWNDQVQLVEWLATHKGPVILSNQATERVIELYQQMDFSLRYFDSPRRISASGDRTPAREVLATRGI
jgi:DNA adenine methylase